jgi:outer membrane protein TolC
VTRWARRVAGVAGALVAASLLAPAGGAPGGLLGAQQVTAAAGVEQPLTLDEALARAQRNNPGYRQSLNSLEISALSHRDAWFAALPQPQLRFLSTNMNWRRQTVAEDFFGAPLPNPEVTTVRTSSSSQSAGFGFQLNLQNIMNLRAQDDEAALQELSVLTQLHALEAEVTRAFLDVQERMTGLQLEEDLLANAYRNREVARELWRVGRRDLFDVRQAELDVADQENQFEQVRSALETSLLGLAHAIGDPELRDFEIEPVPLTEFDPAALDLEAIVTHARTRSPRVEQSEGDLRARERSVNQVRAQWLPTLSFNFSTSRQGFVRGGDAFFDLNPESDWDRTMSLGVNFPDLGQYFRRGIQQSQAEIQVRNQSEALRQVRNEAEQEVRTLVTDLHHQVASLRIQTSRAELAAEQLEHAREAYRIGTRSYLELQSAASQAAQAGRQELAARYNLERALISLQRAVGLDLESMLQVSAGG